MRYIMEPEMDTHTRTTSTRCSTLNYQNNISLTKKTIAIFNKTFPFCAIQTNDTRFSISLRFVFFFFVFFFLFLGRRVHNGVSALLFVLNRRKFEIGHVIEFKNQAGQYTMYYVRMECERKKKNYLFDIVRTLVNCTPFFVCFPFLPFLFDSHFSHKYFVHLA